MPTTPILPGTSDWDRPPGSVHARPWWRTGVGFVHRPARPGCPAIEVFYDAGSRLWRVQAAGERVVGRLFQDADEAMAYADERWLMPHPGRRLGQIWWTPGAGHPGGGLLSRIPVDATSVLLVDALRPSLAPWAPITVA